MPLVVGTEGLDGVDLSDVEMALCVVVVGKDSGLAAVQHLRANRPDLPVVVAGRREDAPVGLAAIRAGALDFILLPEQDPITFRVVIEKCLAQKRIMRENEILREDLSRSLEELCSKNEQLEAVIDQLEVKARTDALTGLSNRRWLNLMLQGSWAEAERNNVPLACLMIDLDGLKSVNDERGHPAGDELIRLAGRVIGESCRAVDVTARYGGDEFCVLMPHTEGHQALAVAERILRSFREATLIRGPGGPVVGLSIGLADNHVSNPDSADQLVTHADQALYAAKSAGKGRVMVRGKDGVYAPMCRGEMAAGGPLPKGDGKNGMRRAV